MPIVNTLRISVAAFVIMNMLVFWTDKPHNQQKTLKGAWTVQNSDTTWLLMCADDYLSVTGYTQQGRRFLFTKGGPFKTNNSALQVRWEYDTRSSENVSTTSTISFRQQGANLTFDPKAFTGRSGEAIGNAGANWQQADNGNAPLAGAWRITQRMQDGKLQTIHQTGTRQTLKLLTGNYFQWIAIDPAVNGFYGTGGGVYTFKDGKYIEQIAFFSRDSSRVGASLQFTGKVENGDWHHSGKSSKGDDIYEVWSRK